MIVDHRKSATDTAPVRTTMTIPEIEKALENRFNQPISIDVSRLLSPPLHLTLT